MKNPVNQQFTGFFYSKKQPFIRILQTEPEADSDQWVFVRRIKSFVQTV
jgi:hypothetical protein